MLNRNWRAIVGAGVLLLGISSGSLVLADTPQKDSSVKRYGVAWNVAEDRKFENINGIYQPEDIDKYMKRYFEQLFAKVSELSMKMDSLSAQVVQLDAGVKALAKKMETSAGASQTKRG